jgi:hypothetical protein
MNKLFLILGITSLVLAFFDFASEGVYEGLLPVAWAAFFFLAFRERLATGSSPGLPPEAVPLVKLDHGPNRGSRRTL